MASDGGQGGPKAHLDPAGAAGAADAGAGDAGAEGRQKERPAGDMGAAMQTAADQIVDQTPALGTQSSSLDSQPPSAPPAPHSSRLPDALGDASAVAVHGSQDVTRGQEAGSGSADARGTGGRVGLC